MTTLSAADNLFRYADLLILDIKHIEMDRVFTNLLPLIKYDGQPVVRGKTIKVTPARLREWIDADIQHFQGFSEHPTLLTEWLRSDFLSLVNRNKDNEQVAAPIPLHLNTYKLRNLKVCRDYGVSEQIFSLLHYGAPQAMKELKAFLSWGVDPYVDSYDGYTELDIQTLLLMRILDQLGKEEPDKRRAITTPPPICYGQGALLGDDIRRLLAYQHHMPRLTLINHIKNVMAMHIGLYLLKMFQIGPYLVEHLAIHPACQAFNKEAEYATHPHECPFSTHVIFDMVDDFRAPMAELARGQFDEHLQHMNEYIRAHITLKKLQECAEDIAKQGLTEVPNSVDDVLAFAQNDTLSLQRDTFFAGRIQAIMATEEGSEIDPRLISIRRLSGLSQLQTYVEMIYLYRHPFHVDYFLESLDSLFQKKSENGMLRQNVGRGRAARRRFVLGSGLLETLAHIGVMAPAPSGGFRTGNVPVSEFIDWLRERYGFFINQLPPDREPSIADLVALRQNEVAFKERLRDIGFYTDLSDAYLAQVIRPRYHVDA